MRFLVAVLVSALALVYADPKQKVYPGQRADGTCDGSNDKDRQPGDIDAQTINQNGVQISLVGQSGQIKITNSTTCEFVKLKWDKLVEVDVNNQKVAQIPSFALQNHFTWSQIFTGIYNGVSYKRIDFIGDVNYNFKKQLLLNPKLNISVIIFPTDVNYRNGNSSTLIPVRGGTAKFTVQIDNWPFQSKNNSLIFGVSFVSGGGRSNPLVKNDDNDYERYNAHKMGSNITTTLIGPGRLDAPSLGFVDWKNCTVRQEINVDTQDGNFGVQWVFPFFEKTFFFDPTLDVTSPDAPATGLVDAGSASSKIILPSLLLSVITALSVITTRHN